MAADTIFLSYSRSDAAFANKLANDLRAAEQSVWIDKQNIPAGARWDCEIELALQQAATVLLILSPESVAAVFNMPKMAMDTSTGLSTAMASSI